MTQNIILGFVPLYFVDDEFMCCSEGKGHNKSLSISYNQQFNKNKIQIFLIHIFVDFCDKNILLDITTMSTCKSCLNNGYRKFSNIDEVEKYC